MHVNSPACVSTDTSNATPPLLEAGDVPRSPAKAQTNWASLYTDTSDNPGNFAMALAELRVLAVTRKSLNILEPSWVVSLATAPSEIRLRHMVKSLDFDDGKFLPQSAMSSFARMRGRTVCR